MVASLLFLQVAISDPSTFTSMYEQLYPQWITAIQPYANELFYALAALDIAVFGWTLIRRHGNNIQGAILSTANRLVLIGAFLALLQNGSTWMADIINMFIQVGKAGSGVPLLQPSVILAQGITICFSLLGQGLKSGAVGAGGGEVSLVAFVVAALAIGASFLIITVEFVLNKIQTFLALGMGFFFLAFGGSGWTRTYVERYFAYAFSSGIRLMTNYFIIGAGLTVSKSWITSANQAPWSLDGAKIAWTVAFGAVIFAALAWKGSALAAQMLGGGPNLSHGDVFHSMSTAAMVGAAAVMGGGAAVGAAGAAISSGVAAARSATSPTGGVSTPPSKPPSSGSGGGSRAAAQASAAAANALRALGSAGSHQVHVPVFKGFGNDD